MGFVVTTSLVSMRRRRIPEEASLHFEIFFFFKLMKFYVWICSECSSDNTAICLEILNISCSWHHIFMWFIGSWCWLMPFCICCFLQTFCVWETVDLFRIFVFEVSFRDMCWTERQMNVSVFDFYHISVFPVFFPRLTWAFIALVRLNSMAPSCSAATSLDAPHIFPFAALCYSRSDSAHSLLCFF